MASTARGFGVVVPRVVVSRLVSTSSETKNRATRANNLALARERMVVAMTMTMMSGPPGRCLRLRAVVSDDNVPEGHANLHNELYGDKSEGGKAHAAVVVNDFDEVLEGELDGTTLFVTSEWLEKRDGTKPCGLYAIYDEGESLKFVGYSRNIVLAIRGYTEVDAEGKPDEFKHCRVKLISGKRLTSRAYMQQQRDSWVEDLTGAKGGEGEGVALSSGQGPQPAVKRSEAEEATHEEQKLKMRKAMGDSLDAPASGQETEDKKQRRLNTIKAVEGDDWSEVIDRQTRETRGQSPATEEGSAPADRVSPFAKPGSAMPRGGEAGGRSVMDADTVNEVLDEVRPYLIADGGNVSVVAVEDGVVKLALEGACGSCASATATMSMGIERALRNHFGSLLKQVVRVDPGAGGGSDEGVAPSAVDAHLDMLRSAIENYGGSVRVKSVDGAVCVVQYKGPPPLSKGIEAAIKDSFPALRQINFVSFD
mmetsp:Transcript_11237/g.31312  ORF Transcript_11237/g.31312 Transcript_11237/m.31312 type:complete len:480 (-) Transcript_11237:42-1481(-)